MLATFRFVCQSPQGQLTPFNTSQEACSSIRALSRSTDCATSPPWSIASELAHAGKRPKTTGNRLGFLTRTLELFPSTTRAGRLGRSNGACNACFEATHRIAPAEPLWNPRPHPRTAHSPHRREASRDRGAGSPAIFSHGARDHRWLSRRRHHVRRPTARLRPHLTTGFVNPLTVPGTSRRGTI